jgi:hypothetical protein
MHAYHRRLQVENWDVANELLHGNFYGEALPCGGGGPCICDHKPACPPEMGVPDDVGVHTWMYKAVSDGGNHVCASKTVTQGPAHRLGMSACSWHILLNVIGACASGSADSAVSDSGDHVCALGCTGGEG